MLNGKYGARGVIVLAFDKAGGAFAGASYGCTRAECAALGRTLDSIMDAIRTGKLVVWP